MATKNLKCKNCGATMEVDEDKGIKFCPYCGSSELIEDNDNTVVKLAKEYRKGKKEEREYHERAQKEGREMTSKQSDTISTVFLICVFIVAVIFVFMVFFK